MNKSDDIKELASSYSKFLGEIKNVEKNAKSHHGNYADLGTILEASRPALAKHGLSVTQLTKSNESGVCVETVLMHASGQWMSEELAMELPKTSNRAQAAGSIITYARRYSLSAILGIAPTDHDMSDKDGNEQTLESLGLTEFYDIFVDAIGRGDAFMVGKMFERLKESEARTSVFWKYLNAEQKDLVKEIAKKFKEDKEGDKDGGC